MQIQFLLGLVGLILVILYLLQDYKTKMWHDIVLFGVFHLSLVKILFLTNHPHWGSFYFTMCIVTIIGYPFMPKYVEGQKTEFKLPF